MFKIILLFGLFFNFLTPAKAQQYSVLDQEKSQENQLSKYMSARAVCARMTDPEALYQRGLLLTSDENSDAYLASTDCFMSAAMRNHTPSQVELGKLYEKGLGVVQSDIFAYKWYQTAVLLGHTGAINLRNSLENKMTVANITAALPLIQGTLDLLDQFTAREMEEITKKEKELETEYQRKFGISLSQFDPPSDNQGLKGNPLIEAMIQEQLKKEGKVKQDEKATSATTAPVESQTDLRAQRRSRRESRKQETVVREKSEFEELPDPLTAMP